MEPEPTLQGLEAEWPELPSNQSSTPERKDNSPQADRSSTKLEARLGVVGAGAREPEQLRAERKG